MENTNTLTVTSPDNNRGFIDRVTLKYIVIAAMLIDHIAHAFGGMMPTMLEDTMHFIGRLTGPTMAFFLAEGAKYTRDIKKYQLRMGIFAVVSWLPFVFIDASIGTILADPTKLIQQSVLYTLFLGITAIRIWDSPKDTKLGKIMLIVTLCILSVIGDWPVMDVLALLFMYIYRDDKKKRYIAVTLTYLFPMAFVLFATRWYQIGVLLVPLIIIYCYNGKGGKKSAFNKWFFYIFYPAHLVVLGILRWYVFV